MKFRDKYNSEILFTSTESFVWSVLSYVLPYNFQFYSRLSSYVLYKLSLKLILGMERLIKMCTYRVVFGLTLIYRVMIWKYRKVGIYRVSNILGGQSVLDKYFKLELCLKMQNKKTAWLSFKVFFCWRHSSNCEKKGNQVISWSCFFKEKT